MGIARGIRLMSPGMILRNDLGDVATEDVQPRM